MRTQGQGRHAVLSLAVGTVVAVLLTGCSGDDKPGPLKLGYVMAPEGAAHEAAQKFAEIVKTKTGGALTVKLYPAGQLGKDLELAENLTLGSVDLVLSGLGSVSPYIPEYEVLEAPFAFADYEHLDRVLNGPIGQEAAEALADKKGIRILAWWPRGPRYLTTTDKPVRKPADLEGMKLRVPKLPTYMKAWEILGARPTPITYKEMYMALKQGTVEGQENPLEVIYTDHLYEVQKYVSKTKHLISSYMLMTTDKLLDRLPPEHAAVLRDAAREAGRYELELVKTYEEDYIKKLQTEGMTFLDVDRDAFREPVLRELPKAFQATWAPGVFERIQELRKAQ